ncbi:MAG: alpha-hydroxy-acid oxidizing protein, partial [Pseudonocardiaceae bacterium]
MQRRQTALGSLNSTRWAARRTFLSILRRIEEAGYSGICVTCDSPSAGWKERNRRNQFVVPEEIVSGNYPGPDGAATRRQVFGQLFSQTEPVWTWDKLGRLMATSPLPWVAKGVLTVADAERALGVGATGLYVSNHGGRQ